MILGILNSIFGLLCTALVFIGPVYLLLRPVLRARRDGLSLKTWAQDKADLFHYGWVPADAEIFTEISRWLSYEPEPPGQLARGVLWNAGSGEHSGRRFFFTTHSPNTRAHKRTVRVLVQSHTHLPNSAAVIISSQKSKVFSHGSMAKKNLVNVDAGPAWQWAQVQSSAGADAGAWLTEERGQILQSTLDENEAVHIYPGFIMAVGASPRNATWVESKLVMLHELLGDATPIPPIADETTPSQELPPLRQRTQWTPMASTHAHWDNMKRSPDGSQIVLTSKPDRAFAIMLCGAALAALVMLVFAFLEDGPTANSIGLTLVPLIFGGVGVRMWTQGTLMAQFDLNERSLWVGLQKKDRPQAPKRVVDLQDAAAIQILTQMDRNTEGGAMRTVELNMIRSDGSRNHLIEIRETHVDRDDPEAILGVNLASFLAEGLDIPLLQHH